MATKRSKKDTTKGMIPVTRATLEPYAAYAPFFKKIIESGMLTSGEHTRALEKKAARYLGVDYCVAVSSCTAGLMLVCKGLGLTGEVILPSFTFSATGHPLVWSGIKPVFADIDPDTYTLDPVSVEKLITPRTSAILATHVYGAMCDVKKLEALARKHHLKLVFDAAHAFGSSYRDVPAGNFGDAEVFSMSPVKVLTAAEGGLVVTNNKALADFVRLGRNYGDDGTNNTLFAGLSARLSELHAAVGLRSLARLKPNLASRRSKAVYLTRELKKIEPTLRFQSLSSGSKTTHYIFTIYIDPRETGYTRDELHEFFKAHGIMTRKYFYPPLHTQDSYKRFAPRKKRALPVTERVARNILALPLYAHITKRELDRILAAYRAFKHGKHL